MQAFTVLALLLMMFYLTITPQFSVVLSQSNVSLFHVDFIKFTSGSKNTVILIFGGGLASFNRIMFTPVNESLINFCKTLSEKADVFCMNVSYNLNSFFFYPENSSAVENVLEWCRENYDAVHLLGYSCGAIIVMDFAQKQSWIGESVIFSAPTNMLAIGRIYHLAHTANETKIPLLFVLPSLDEDFCRQMNQYYVQDMAEKKAILWSVQHDPFVHDPMLLSKYVFEWCKL